MITPDIRLQPLIFGASSLFYLLVFSREACCIFVVLHAYALTHTQAGEPTRRTTVWLERNLPEYPLLSVGSLIWSGYPAHLC
jgi:hypothetical protein